MRQRLIQLCALALPLSLALVGCASSDDTTDTDTSAPAAATSAEATGDAVDVNEDGTVNNPEAVAVDPNKLVFWSLFSGGDGDWMEQIVDDYNATGPAKQVQVVMLVWADYYTKLSTAVSAGKGPDIGVSHMSKLPELVANGIVQSFDDYAATAGTNWSEYPTASTDGVTFDGEHYAIPLDTHAEIMYINKDYIEAAGIELTDNKLAISSVDDFTAILSKLKDTVGDGNTALALTQTGDDPYRVWWATYFQMGGTPLVSDDGKSITLDKAIATQAAEWVKSLYTDGYVQPGIQDHQKMFQEGKAGLLFGGTWATGVFEATASLNFVPQLFPTLFNGSDAAWADAHTLIIPTNKDRTDEETQAAVDFINYAATKGGVTGASSGQIPANSTVTSDPEYLALPYASYYSQEKDKAVLPSQNEHFYALKDTMIKNLDTIWNDQVTPEAGIANMADEMEADLA
jgi:multiple sugar transport system substrate-binding protein